jgi:hypothetical protein
MRRYSPLLFLVLAASFCMAEITGVVTEPGGSDGQVQYNNNGIFYGDSDFTFNGSSLTASNLSTSNFYATVANLGSLGIVNAQNPTPLSIGSASSNGAILTPAGMFFQIDSGNHSTSERFEVRHNGTGYSDGIPLFTILENGNVGVGTSTPTSQLDVNGTLTVGGTLTLNGPLASPLIIKGPSPWIDVRAYGAIGDGVTNDRVSIQAALDLPGPKTVFLPKGIYKAENLSIPSSTTLFGFGDATIVGSSSSTAILKNSDQTNGNTEIRVTGISLNGSKKIQWGIYFVKVGNFSVDHIRGKEMDQWGAFVQLITCTDGSLSDNVYEGNHYGLGFNIFDACQRITAIGNKFYYPYEIGIDVAMASTDAYPPCKQISIIGNTIIKTKGGDTGYGISCHNNVSDVTISGNTVIGGLFDGILVYNQGTGYAHPRRVSIVGNVVENSGRNGIGIDIGETNVGEISVYANIISTPAEHGILVAATKVSISGNMISHVPSGYQDIFVYGTSSGTQIFGNGVSISTTTDERLHIVGTKTQGWIPMKLENTDSNPLSLSAYQLKTGYSPNVWCWYLQNDSLQAGIYGSNPFLSITNTGRVGVSSTTPTQKFTVYGAGADNIIQSVDAGGPATYLQSDSTTGRLGTIGAYPLLFYVNGVERARLNTSGGFQVGALTGGKVLQTTTDGVLEASLVSTTTLSYLDPTSSVQTQLNAKAPAASPVFTGSVAVGTTTPSQRFTVYDAAGANNIIQAQCGAGAAAYIQADATTAIMGAIGNYPISVVINGVSQISISTTGYVDIPGVYAETTASAANVFVASDGSLRRSTSARRYKKDIQPYSGGLSSLLHLNPVTFVGKDDKTKTRHAGFIADDVDATADKNLRVFVVYDDKKAPDALEYSNMSSLLVNAIKELSSTCDLLKRRIEILEKK